MDLTMKTCGGLNALSFLVSVVMFLIWLFRRLAKHKEKHTAELTKAGSYTTAQVFGIIGILFFMLPVLYITIGYLSKGALLLFFFLFSLLPLPKLIRVPLDFVMGTGMNFLVFSGTYMLCEFIWPEKVPTNDRDLV